MEFYGETIIGVITPFIALSAFTIPLLSLFIKRKGFYNAYALAISFITMIFSALVFLDIYYDNEHRPLVYAYGGWPPPIGIVYEVDLFNGLLAAYASFMMFLVVVYSIWYSRFLDNVAWYYTLLLGLETGVLGCLYTGDAFNLFVMIEVLSISAYALVAYYKNRAEAVEAAIKYAIIGAVVTTLYFIALVFIYSSYGTLNMADICFKAQELRGAVNVSNGLYGSITVASLVALALALWAFTFKSALFPNHFWVPDVYSSAPMPVPAAFSSAVEIVGVYLVVRFLYTLFGPGSIIDLVGYRDAILTILLILGIASGVFGALLMITQNNVNRLLGYSTISHIGLLYMALALGFTSLPWRIVSLALTALLFHIINHGIGKMLLFVSLGPAVASGNSRDMNKLYGAGRLYPLASAAIIVAVFNLMGLIPFAGFFSKLLIYQAYMEAGWLVPAIMVIVVSAISVLGYAKVMYSIVFAPPIREYKRYGLGGLSILMMLLIVLSIGLGVLSPWVIGKLNIVVSSSLSSGGVEKYVSAFTSIYRALTGG